MIVKHKISVKIGLTMLMTLILLPLSGCGGRSDIGEPRDNIAAAEEDALNITVHREALRDGNWISIEPRPDAATQINTAIVIQARLLRRDNAPLTSR